MKTTQIRKLLSKEKERHEKRIKYLFSRYIRTGNIRWFQLCLKLAKHYYEIDNPAEVTRQIGKLIIKDKKEFLNHIKFPSNYIPWVLKETKKYKKCKI